MPNPRLDAAYAAQVTGVRARVEAFVQARFSAGQYRDADLTRFLNEVVPVVKASRVQISALTDAYLAQVLSDLLGVRIPARGPIDTSSLRGVADSEVLARPFVTVRTELARGKSYPDAVAAGSQRLTDITATDMQLAKTHTAQSVLEQTKGVSGFRRVLKGSKNCALCYLASTQAYHRGDLMPIHPGCDCDVLPLAEGTRGHQAADGSWRVIDPKRLEQTHGAVLSATGIQDAGGRAPDYRKLMIVREHGEIGPLLAVRGQGFTGPSGLN